MVKVILFFLLIGAVLYLIVTSEQLERAIRKRQPEQADRLGRFRALFKREADAAVDVSPKQFAHWVKQSLPMDGETATWFDALDDTGLGVVRDFSADFCQDMGFELAWLVNGTLPDDVGDTLEGVLSHYLSACRMTLSVREEIVAFGSVAVDPASPTPTEKVIKSNGHLAHTG